MSQLNTSYSERDIICDGLAALVGICRDHSKSFQNVKFLVLYVKVNCVSDFDEGRVSLSIKTEGWKFSLLASLEQLLQ